MSAETDAMDAAVPDLEDGRDPEPGEQPTGDPAEGEIPHPGAPAPAEPEVAALITGDMGGSVVMRCEHEHPEIVARTKGLTRHGGTRLVRWCPACGAIRVGPQPWRAPGAWNT